MKREMIKNKARENRTIYLDNNSTTALDPIALEAMMPYLTNEYGNANSTHTFGVKANEAVKHARRTVAELIGAEPHEIVFTSGATEALNTAIKGIAYGRQGIGKHIITTKTEHSAVLDICAYLENQGFEITYLPVKANGQISLSELVAQLRRDTILVAIMIANNETGVIQPIKEISEILSGEKVLFLSDATQAVGKMHVNVDDLGIDLMAFSAHKLHGPKGVGGLFVRQRNNRIKLPPLIHGGGHERGMRSGTLNVPGIIGFGEACNLAIRHLENKPESVCDLRDFLERELLKIPDTRIIGYESPRLGNTTNILFNAVDSDALILGLSQMQGDISIAVSNGSACTSASIEPSHVLKAMGLTDSQAFYCIRFSLSRMNTKDEILDAIRAVTLQVNQLRSMAY